jgi:hypothetical protein
MHASPESLRAPVSVKALPGRRTRPHHEEFSSAALDQETLALVRRAQPFPAPPAAMPGAQIDLAVPIRFNMH